MNQTFCTNVGKKLQNICCQKCRQTNLSTVESTTKRSFFNKKKKTNVNIYLRNRNQFNAKRRNRCSESTSSEILGSDGATARNERMRQPHKFWPKSQLMQQERQRKKYCECNKCREYNNVTHNSFIEISNENDVSRCCKCCPPPYHSNNNQDLKNPLHSKFGYYLNPKSYPDYRTRYQCSCTDCCKKNCNQQNCVWASIRESANFDEGTSPCNCSNIDKEYDYNKTLHSNMNNYELVYLNDNYNKIGNNLKSLNNCNKRLLAAEYGKCRVCSKPADSYSDLQLHSSSTTSVVRQLWINRRPIEMQKSLTNLEPCSIQLPNNYTNNSNGNNLPQHRFSKYSLKYDYSNCNHSCQPGNDYFESVVSFSSTTNVMNCCCNQNSAQKKRFKRFRRLKRETCKFPLCANQNNQAGENIYNLVSEPNKLHNRQMCCTPYANQGDNYIHEPTSELVSRNIKYFIPAYKRQCNTCCRDAESKCNISGSDDSLQKPWNPLGIQTKRGLSKLHYLSQQLNSKLKQLKPKLQKSYEICNGCTLWKNRGSHVSYISPNKFISEDEPAYSDTNISICDEGYEGDAETETGGYMNQNKNNKQTMLCERRKRNKLNRRFKIIEKPGQQNNSHNPPFKGAVVQLCDKFRQPCNRPSGGHEQTLETHKSIMRSSRLKLAAVVCSRCCVQNCCQRNLNNQHGKTSKTRSISVGNRVKLLVKPRASNNSLIQRLNCYKEESQILDEYKFYTPYNKAVPPTPEISITNKTPPPIDWLKGAKITTQLTKNGSECNKSSTINSAIKKPSSPTKIGTKNMNMKESKVENDKIDGKEMKTEKLKISKTKEEFDSKVKAYELKESLDKKNKSKIDKLKTKSKETAVVPMVNSKIIEKGRSEEGKPKIKQATSQPSPINILKSPKQPKTLPIKTKSPLRVNKISSSQQISGRRGNLRSLSKYDHVPDAPSSPTNSNVKSINESKTKLPPKPTPTPNKINRPQIFVAKKNFQEHLKNMELLKGHCSAHNYYLPSPQLVKLH